MRLLAILLLVVGAPAVAAQPASLVVTPDTLFLDRYTGSETPFMIRNLSTDSLRFDSLAIGECSGPYCGGGFFGLAYYLRFELAEETYFGLLWGPDFTIWDPEPPRATMEPGAKAFLYFIALRGRSDPVSWPIPRPSRGGGNPAGGGPGR
jgi:hypothetical protein